MNRYETNDTNEMKDLRDHNLYTRVRTLHEYLISVHNEFLRLMLKDQHILQRLSIHDTLKDYPSVIEDKDYDSSKFTSKDLSNLRDNFSSYSENINRVHDVIEDYIPGRGFVDDIYCVNYAISKQSPMNKERIEHIANYLKMNR